MFAAKASFRSEKAARLLGYHPAFDLDRGMAMTEQWARWANAI
jgi:nucleoside-diphosphate-sugar epimerase